MSWDQQVRTLVPMQCLSGPWARWSYRKYYRETPCDFLVVQDGNRLRRAHARRRRGGMCANEEHLGRVLSDGLTDLEAWRSQAGWKRGAHQGLI